MRFAQADRNKNGVSAVDKSLAIANCFYLLLLFLDVPAATVFVRLQHKFYSPKVDAVFIALNELIHECKMLNKTEFGETAAAETKPIDCNVRKVKNV